ncbi:hypothetical protein [Fusibacter ferrireducens]|uniref:ABC transporter permease n=1 Tax=Fusibacter ferrireducens TaxID=2785058 RepID=A0ABR9ZZ74_9FIRM|nr:hypothetical protein [Fusibacter ferrireducens]MBF4695755.1 hypothetical protein [Fusibacter ferrireducens]
MIVKIENYVPVGIDYEQEIKWICIGLIMSTLYSFGFLFSLSREYSALFTGNAFNPVLRKDAIMPDFVELFGHYWIGFLIVVLCMIALFVHHYTYHYQNSKSIYLMRRLPKRWELLKRCVALPLFSSAASMLIALLLMLVYFGIYLSVTPETCLAPDQWQKIWHFY